MTWALLLCQGSAVWVFALAVYLSREAKPGIAMALAILGLVLTYASALWVLTRPGLSRLELNAAVISLGVTTAIQFRLKNPLFLVGFDEQLHWRTLRDVQASHGVLQTNPLLPVSSRYPGLEALTALFTQIGVPTLAAAVGVVLLCRVLLVTVLRDAVENLTGSARAGGLAVAGYAVCDQFVVFISQYAYQTLALPLALAAVSLVARARWVRNPTLLLSGAAVCLLAVVVTHHVTNLLTAAFLCGWAVAQRGHTARRRVRYAAIISVVLTTMWITVQWSRLKEYFEPIVEYTTLLIVGNHRRELFSDSSGSSTPPWEQAFLLYYALSVCVVVAWLVAVCLRSAPGRLRRRSQSDVRSWNPPVLLVVITALIPPVLAARVIPNSGETVARAPGFLFLPFSLLMASGLAHWYRGRGTGRIRGLLLSRMALTRTVGITLATGVFIGGFLLGSGPGWLRLPGPYMVSADSRSMDAEALTAVKWARDNLPSGSRVGADRVASVLLAGQADLWPVFEVGDQSVSSLYFADSWTDEQTALVRQLHLRYLYVDGRLADGLPNVGSYFLTVRDDESGRQLTRENLAKFDNVPGLRAVYRSGPIVVYDLHGLGVDELRTGYFGEAKSMGALAQMLAGFLVGLAFVALLRTRAGAAVTRGIHSFRSQAGPALSAAVAVGVACSTAVVLLFAHIWVGPGFCLTTAIVLAFAHRRRIAGMTHHLTRRVSWAWVAASVAFALLVGSGVFLAVMSAVSSGSA